MTFVRSFSLPSRPIFFFPSAFEPSTLTRCRTFPVKVSQTTTSPSGPLTFSLPDNTHLSLPPKQLLTLNSSFLNPSSLHPTRTPRPSLVLIKLVTLPPMTSVSNVPVLISYHLTLPSTLPLTISHSPPPYPSSPPFPARTTLTLSLASSITITGFILPALMSHILTLLSKPPLTNTLSSLPPNTTLLTRDVCPLFPPNFLIVFAVCTSHRNTLRSPPHEANVAFVDATAIDSTS